MTKDTKKHVVARLRKASKTNAEIDEIAEKMLEMGYSEDIVGPKIESLQNNQRTPQEIADIVGVSLATVYRYFNELDNERDEYEAQLSQ